MKTGGNVHLGPYAGHMGGPKKMGKHGKPKQLVDTHRETSAIPKIKGHHFKGKMSRKTGGAFGDKGH